MSFRDMTYYSKHHYENALNIGFQKKQKVVNTSVDNELIQSLKKYIPFPVNMERGGMEVKIIQENDGEIALGFSEIRVIASDGTVYAAPDIIIAYIMEGLYDPPQEFKDAVLHGIAPESKEYANYYSRYDAEHFWGATDEYVHLIHTLKNLIKNDDTEQIKVRLTQNDKLKQLLTENGSLIGETIINGSINTIKCLIDLGVSLDMFEGRELFQAIDCGKEDVVKLLFDTEIEYNVDDIYKNPLFYAIDKKQNKIAKKLFLSRKDFVRTYHYPNQKECNILTWCKVCNNSDFIKIIQNEYKIF